MSEYLVPFKKKVRQTMNDNPLRDAVAGNAFPIMTRAQKGETKNKRTKSPTRSIHPDYLGIAPPSGRPENPNKDQKT